MGQNTTVYFRGKNLENVKKKVKPGLTQNEIINIAVEEYLNKQNDELRK